MKLFLLFLFHSVVLSKRKRADGEDDVSSKRAYHNQISPLSGSTVTIDGFTATAESTTQNLIPTTDVTYSVGSSTGPKRVLAVHTQGLHNTSGDLTLQASGGGAQSILMSARAAVTTSILGTQKSSIDSSGFLVDAISSLTNDADLSLTG